MVSERSSFQSRIEEAAHRRDGEINDLREGFAATSAVIRSIEARDALHETRLSAIERRPQPGILAYWGPAITTALALGAFIGWMVNQQNERMSLLVAPLEHDVAGLHRDFEESKQVHEKLDERIYQLNMERREGSGRFSDE